MELIDLPNFGNTCYSLTFWKRSKLIKDWPLKCGGGTETTQNLIIIILKIFNIPFNQQIYDREVDEISAGLAKADIIYLTLNALKYLEHEVVDCIFLDINMPQLDGMSLTKMPWQLTTNMGLYISFRLTSWWCSEGLEKSTTPLIGEGS